MNTKFDVLVVGAGAAGLIAAGRAAEKGAKVLLVEKMERPGRKLLITGKGRCNISNDAPQSTYYKNIFPNGRYLKHAFSAFFSKDIVNLLNELGVEVTTERGNRIFPTSNQAKEVQQALLKWVKKQGVEIQYNTRVSDLIIVEETIRAVKLKQKTTESEIVVNRVIICTGGKSYPATGSTGDGYALASHVGHKITEARPALVPLVTGGSRAESLQGLSLKNAKASLWVDGKKQCDEFGELLFTHFGLSGPIVLTLSRMAVDNLIQNRKVTLAIDLKPALDEQKLDARLLRDIDANGKKHVDNLFRSWLPAKMIPVFLEELEIDGSKEVHQITAKERKKIGYLMKNFEFEITGHRGFKEAIVTAGGVDTSEVNNKTMESTLIKGLYFAGEVLDLDANTGGFNLQIAWSTGWLAGESCTSDNQC